MIAQIYSMPAVCSNCGGLFDMSYDMKKGIEDFFEKPMSKKNMKKSKLCWECRNTI